MSEHAPRLGRLVAIEGGDAEEPADADASDVRASLRAAFRAHHGAVYTTAYRILSDAADAEDVTQAVFERLVHRMQRADGIRNPERLAAFLKSCAVRECLMLLRRRRWWSSPRAAKAIAVVDVDPATQPHAFFVAAVGQLLSVLSAEERAIVVLEIVEHHSHAEVAEIMGLSVSTIRRRLASATRRLAARARDDVARRLAAELEAIS